MSQKNVKRKRKQQKAITSIIKNNTLLLSLKKCKELNKDFDDLSDLDKLKVVLDSRSTAIQSLNRLLGDSYK